MTARETPGSGPGANLPKTSRGRHTRLAILRAAETVIGEKGFAAASIADITRTAGIAQGTFYIYFQSKDEVFAELVAEMSRWTRASLSEAVADAPDRMAAERAGLEGFLRFVRGRPALYNIVEEARFFNPDAYRAYFEQFAAAYVINLERAVEEGEIRPGRAEIRAWALMGIARSLGERYGLWDDGSDITAIVDEVMEMIETGLRP